jgi:ABC-type Fe3+-hydroxamate transport system substrate-binding protein
MSISMALPHIGRQSRGGSKLLAFALAALLINLACATSAPAQLNTAAARIDKLRRDVEKIGFDERVEVKLNDGTKLKGRVTGIADEQFVITDQKGTATRIPYSNIKRVVKHDDTTGPQLRGLALGVGVLAGVLALLFIVGRKDYVAR